MQAEPCPERLYRETAAKQLENISGRGGGSFVLRRSIGFCQDRLPPVGFRFSRPGNPRRCAVRLRQ